MEETLRTALRKDQVYDHATSEKLRKDFSRLKGECYLDHTGATLHSDMQIQNITDDLSSSLYANPHSFGVASGITHDIIERTRFRILQHFHTSPDEYSVIFTSGATSSLKIVAESFLFKNKDEDGNQYRGNFVYTQDNHTSVLGMRDVVVKKEAKVTCIKYEEAFKVIDQSSIPLNLNTKWNTNSLFVYPAQCNFSGLKYPLRWIERVHKGALSATIKGAATKWYILLDAASFVPTNTLDLSIFKPDFVSLSFYKMFGYPTGIGALLVKNSSVDSLEKIYYGGGTVEVSLSSEMFHLKRKKIHERFEDGTIPFLSIIALRHGFDMLSKLTMNTISCHVFSLAKYLYYSLLSLHHHNGKPVAKIYSDTDYKDRNLQGGVVTFNLVRSNGEYIGYMEVLNMAALFKIHIRTGCFCNPGACQRHLMLSNKEILQNYDAGYVCGGTKDLLGGKPTGAVRISLGYMSTIEDVEYLLSMIKKCFLDGPEVIKLPCWCKEKKSAIMKKCGENIIEESNCPINNDDNNAVRNLQNKTAALSSVITNTKYFISNTNKLKRKPTVVRLFVYPIKSCGSFEVTDSWILNSKGLEYDREWMIVTSAGLCLTQKRKVNLCLIKPTIHKKRKTMELNYPGMPSIEIPLEYSMNYCKDVAMCQSRVCGHGVKGIDCGSDIAEWLSLALGQPNLRLVRQCKEFTEDQITPAISFSSQAQYLLLNEASILWLANSISANTDLEKDTMLYRFRGNIVLNGYDAFEEVQWKCIRIGKNDFMVNGPCTRCQMICIDQTTGRKTVEPLRTLAQEFHGKLSFGIYLTRLTNELSALNIGDIVDCT